MNDLQISYFLSVAETGNITESARQLYVSVPAVSKQILALEEELGFALFERTSRGVKLLPEGRRVRELFLSSRKQLRQLKQSATAGTVQALPPFRLCLPIDWMPCGLLSRLREVLAAAEPTAPLLISGLEMTDMLDALESGNVDMCLLSMASPDPADYRHRQQYLRPLKRVVLYGLDNPAARQAAAEGRAPALSELAGTPLIITDEAVMENSSAFCVSHGINPEFRAAGTMHSVLQTVGAGIGFCITDEWCIAADHAGFGRLDMPDTAHACLYWLPEKAHPLTEKVVSSLI